MKIRLTITKLLLVLFGLVAAPAVFAQTSPDTALLIWTGPGNDIDYETNWGNTVNPFPIPTLTTMEWNGLTTSNLNLVYNAGYMASGAGGNGYNLYMTSAQTNSVTIGTTLGTSQPLAISDIQIDAGAGAFTLGGATSATVMEWIGRPGGFLHTLMNNSTNTATITPNLFFQAGAGAVFTLDFSGTGNWVVSNYLGNNNGPTITIEQDGPGTLTWTPTGYVDADGISSPITITGGTLILAGPHPLINNQQIIDDAGATFEFNAPGQSQTLAGAILGGGVVQVNAGTLTLGGQSAFTGNLVLNGGTVLADGAENGTAGPLGEGNNIVFNGGTLEFTSIDFADYSAVFSTTAGQQYKINANGQTPIFATGLTSSGGSLNFTGPGSLTLAGSSTYTGGSTVNSGKLILQGSLTGTGNITVADSAALGVFQNGTQFTPAILTLGTSTGATLEFNNVNSTATAIIDAGSLSTAGTITVNVLSGALNPAQSYPLLTWTSGSSPTFVLGTLNGFIGNLTVVGNTLKLNVTGTAYKWTGLTSGTWDLTTANNWVQNGGPVVFANGGPVLLDDTATGTTVMSLGATILPTTVTFNNSTLIYSLTSSLGNDIGGPASLTKSGTQSLTMAGGQNVYTGVTTINAGIVSVGTLANGGTASDIGAANSNATTLVLNGGDLQYTGPAVSIDRLFSVGTSGGTLDASGFGALQLTNTGAIGLSGSGGRVLTLTGTDTETNVLAGVLSDSAGGATQLAVSGTTTWSLTATNTSTGLVTVNPGATLQVGAGGATGSLAGSIHNNGRLIFNNTAIVTNSAITGTGSLTVAAGTVILSANNTYNGGTTIDTNATLEVGNGGAAGALFDASRLVNNGQVIFNDTAGQTLVNTAVSGTGSFIFAKGFTEISAFGDVYSGWVQINAGATFQPSYGNEPVPPISAITNNGTLYLTRQDGIPPISAANPVVYNFSNNIVGTGKFVKENNNQNAGGIGLSGVNTYSGNTLIAGGAIILGDNTTVGGGSIVGKVIFTNTSTSFDNPRTLVFYRPDNFIFTNNITSVVTTSAGGNFGTVEESGTGYVTLTGNNTYTSGTIIDTATQLQVGAGGTSGNLGAGTVTDNGSLVYDRADNVTFSNRINGPGTFTQIGGGTVTLTASNAYSGPTTISNGTLVLNYAGNAGTNEIQGDLDVYGGAIIVGGVGSNTTFNVAGAMNISAGTVYANLNKLLAPSNTTYVVVGAITATGGTLELINYGPALVPGDRFVIFNQAVAGGGTMTVYSPGVTFNNTLATDGSVTVATVQPPPTITASFSGSALSLSWPANYTGLSLQVQTNTINVGVSNNWVTIASSSATNVYTNTIVRTNATVFYRLVP